MPTAKKKINLYESEEGAVVQASLRKMAADDGYSTLASYSANGEAHPDHVVSFVEKHMTYLNTHPSVDPTQYLANLRLMTKKR